MMVVQPAGAFDWVKKSPVKCSGNARSTISEQMTGKPWARRTWATAPPGGGLPDPGIGSEVLGLEQGFDGDPRR
jgi:hypothetical protein